jgi:hypothetical protein
MKLANDNQVVIQFQTEHHSVFLVPGGLLSTELSWQLSGTA